MQSRSGFTKCFGVCLLCFALCALLSLLSACAGSPRESRNSAAQSRSEVTEGDKGKEKIMAASNLNESPFACDMSALNTEERRRILFLLEQLKTRKQEVKELPDGYAFRYQMTSDMFREAAEFITYERLCCPFFEFELAAERENGAMWLRLKGRDGAKDFIRAEFSL
jgi:hypothetical protein